MYIEIIVDKLAVRVNPDKQERLVSFLNKGDYLTIIKRQGDWIQHEKGWSLSKENDSIFIKPILLKEKPNVKKVEPKKNTRASENESGGSTTSPTWTYEEEPETDYVQYNSESVSNTGTHFLQNVRGVHGMPYQYMSSVDPRAAGHSFGRKFSSKIVARIPLLLMTPGKPEFMAGYSDNQKKGILGSIINKDNMLDDMVNGKDGKYYSFKFAYNEYYQRVNPMLQKMAILLGLGDTQFDGKDLQSYEWQNYANPALKNFISSKEIVAFYLDSDTQISESFSNDSRESALSSTVGGFSDMAKEMQFLLGGISGELHDKLAGNAESALAELDQFQSSYSSILPTNVLNKLKEGVYSLMGGGKMIFPEIWSDSNFSRQYDVSIKLRSPDGDALSIFLNILVPIAHLIGLAAPHQMSNNTYNSPFLIRAFYKGFFNIDMGIVTSLNINKGDKSKWTLHGLPTEVDINMGLKDLYQIMTISSEKNLAGMLNNTMQLDYLANLCGVNINKPDIMRSIDIYYNQVKNSVINTITFDGFLGVENALTNMLNKLYRR